MRRRTPLPNGSAAGRTRGRRGRNRPFEMERRHEGASCVGRRAAILRFVPRVQVQGGGGRRRRRSKLGVTSSLGSKVATTSSTTRAGCCTAGAMARKTGREARPARRVVHLLASADKTSSSPTALPSPKWTLEPWSTSACSWASLLPPGFFGTLDSGRRPMSQDSGCGTGCHQQSTSKSTHSQVCMTRVRWAGVPASRHLSQRPPTHLSPSMRVPWTWIRFWKTVTRRGFRTRVLVVFKRHQVR